MERRGAPHIQLATGDQFGRRGYACRAARRVRCWHSHPVLALAIAAAVTAAGTSSFGGGDAAVQRAHSTAFTSSPVTHDGITISVTGMAADDTETVIGLDIEGAATLAKACCQPR